MKCPTCHDKRLRPTQLDYGLPSVGCTNCRGFLVSLVAYRMWAETFRELEEDIAECSTGLESDTKSALLCPKCERVMLKFKYTVDRDGNLDLCTHCDEIWLDSGEWERLKVLNLVGDIPAVFTKPWQRALREARSADVIAGIWQKRLGADYDKVVAFRDWLEENPAHVDILTFINNLTPDRDAS